MKDEYTYRMDYIAEDITKDIRIEITNRVRETVNKNQDTFLANWLIQNPSVDLSKVRLCHGFQETHYQFWVQDYEDNHLKSLLNQALQCYNEGLELPGDWAREVREVCK